MREYKVVEKFVSINGEGTRAGELAVFIRFKGCNLNCSYCDTTWANEEEAPYTIMNDQEIYDYIKSTGVRNVTLTGGEPLLREGMGELITKLLEDSFLRVEIETNGSVDLEPFTELEKRPSFTMDYKLMGSQMESFMNVHNFSVLEKEDTVKFVAGSRADLEKAAEMIEEYQLLGKCNLYFSPVFGKIEPREMVDFLMERKLNDVRIQIQMHKVIWDPNERGV